MVVCKCRKATKLYCFVHRTPVCLDCVCAPDHEHCVVWQYSDWVNDGDYDWPPICVVCQESLEASAKPTIRLGCLHVPHAECLQRHLEGFPPHTAPAGYTCPAPSCNVAVWPPRAHKDAASTLYTNLRALITQSAVADTLLKAPIAPHGFATPPLTSSSREASTEDLRSLPPGGASAPPGSLADTRGMLNGADAEPGAAPGKSVPAEKLPQVLPAQTLSPPQPPVPVARSRGGASSVTAGGGPVAVDIEEEYSQGGVSRPDYGTDGDSEKKYARRGSPYVQFLRYFGLRAPPTLPTRKDREEVAEETGLRRSRSQRPAAVDPRRLLLALAVGSCMATMLLLYYRLAQGGIPGDARRLP